MRRTSLVAAAGLVCASAVWIGACDSGDDGGGGASTTATGVGVVGGSGGAGGAGGAAGNIVRLTIFHTSDEHGWLVEDDATDPATIWGGAANVMGWLVGQEGYVPGEQLLLSGGDNWSGAAVSTWFEGEPMVEAFNAMGYAAAAVGNHEFDFGRDVLQTRVAQADYPYLSANITDSTTGEPPSFATPFVVVPVQGVQVGIVGLTADDTGTTAHPLLVAGLEFGAYHPALEQTVPEARAAGAEVVVVLAHACEQQLRTTLEFLTVEVDLALVGHCHDMVSTEAAGIPVVGSGEFFHAYSRIDLDFDRTLGAVVHHEVTQQLVQYPVGEPNPVTPDPTVAAIADHWQQQADALLGQEVGYTSGGIAQGGWPMANWVVDAWLWAVPDADIALNNFGSLRQSIPAGSFTMGDVVGMLPFDNNLYQVEVTGAELDSELTNAQASCSPNLGCYPSLGGASFVMQGSDLQVSLAGGGALDPAATYKVLITDFLYYGGDGYGFEAYDPTPLDTGMHMRQPVLDWTTQLSTSNADPLENYLDSAPRDQ